jgi:hypothetical protein
MTMEITGQSRLFDILEAYPSLEAQIVNIAPPFRNLTNPILRRTVGKLATLEKVAQIGGMDAGKLVNTLRRAVGQAELSEETPVPLSVRFTPAANDPEWINAKPDHIVNGTELLRHGEVPLGRINELLGLLAPGGLILLVTDFEPSPILDALRKQNRQVFHKMHPDQPDQHLTFIQSSPSSLSPGEH